ncbi:unnamed protein product [Citrullus colocynthis]|uniref:Apple domain-containing protein n=1 Tax=Citrullus colocynthis TaxID=252529 RepID=A0ABP0Z3N7_9ROSI
MAVVKKMGLYKVEMVKVAYFVEWSTFCFTSSDCKQECLNNCFCNAYAYEDGIRCMLWRRDELIDIQKFESGGASLYLRMPYAELAHTKLPVYDFEKLVIATNNFDIDNKLGQGGFGPVYKVDAIFPYEERND